MPKPKVYIDKDGSITIIFPKDVKREDCSVTLVHDRGVEFAKQHNFFNEKLPRFVYHHASAYGDRGHSSNCDTYDKEDLGIQYKLTRKL